MTTAFPSVPVRPWRVSVCALVWIVAACSKDPGGAPAEEKVAEKVDHAALDTEGTEDLLVPSIEDTNAAGPGNWRRPRPRHDRADGEVTDTQREEMQELEAIGYATGSREMTVSGVTIHRRDKVYAGLNLYTSGHGPDALLVDMEGKELHNWHCTFAEAFGDQGSDAPKSRGSQWWCWMHLYENGDILALFSGEGIVKLNARSEVLWARQNRAHHDVAVADDGDIYVLTRKASLIPRVHPTRPVLEDFITVMGPDGETKKSFSLLEAFERSPFPRAWKSYVEHGDVFHSNALVLLDGCGCDRVPALAKGNLLFSMAKPNLVAAVDPESEKVVWVRKGQFRMQHNAQIIAPGNLLLFDNKGLDMNSRALEIDPVTGESVWEYRGTEQDPLFSRWMGGVQRLPNGNTLITESDNGRVIEVTAEGEVVWEFHTPYHGGENGEFIAAICRMERLPPDHPVGWIGPR